GTPTRTRRRANGSSRGGFAEIPARDEKPLMKNLPDERTRHDVLVAREARRCFIALLTFRPAYISLHRQRAHYHATKQARVVHTGLKPPCGSSGLRGGFCFGG